MSLKSLSLLFINLGGEMMYILDQRLRAQNIPQDKAAKVLHDIIATMFNKRFMEELFKPQELYSRKAMRTVFDRLAHASIMRLNAASMDKLYDLMTMAFKYQVSLCLRPRDILMITLNHMDAIAAFVQDAPNAKSQVEYVYTLIKQNFGSMSLGEFQLIRQTLLIFFQDMHIRVSIFLKDKVQNSNGRFVLSTSGALPYGTEMPGTIRIFNSQGDQVKTSSFYAAGPYKLTEKEGSSDMKGNRETKLGTNMYNVAKSSVEAMAGSGPSKPGSTTSSATDMDHGPNPMAKAQLDLLSRLIGGGEKKTTKKSEFRLNLFTTDAEEEEAAALRPAEEPGSQVINIDATKKQQNQELNKIMGELNVASDDQDNGGGDDLLDLMDSA
ncbi:protein OSCP1-like [Lingula anatina]|uniref:Protein OSCP1-like n=1 Tax=Lingula anatina TaxID=7574 RepID=A0A1S3K2A0_LINAN|nr:protein OSCP1-like [Lingula anatina]|eukprot:XP_013416760.1 protein OSCP1-like [Lingula anatina]